VARARIFPGNPHVLPPRPAGVLACLAARPDLDVVVVAHTGRRPGQPGPDLAGDTADREADDDPLVARARRGHTR
jgi:hypothetical protein